MSRATKAKAAARRTEQPLVKPTVPTQTGKPLLVTKPTPAPVKDETPTVRAKEPARQEKPAPVKDETPAPVKDAKTAPVTEEKKPEVKKAPHVAKDSAPTRHAPFLDEKFSIKVFAEEKTVADALNRAEQAFRKDRRERKADKVGRLMNKPEFSHSFDTTLPGGQRIESGAYKPKTDSEVGKVRGTTAMSNLPEALTKNSPHTELKKFGGFATTFTLGELKGDTAEIVHKESKAVVGALVLVPRREQFILFKGAEGPEGPGEQDNQRTALAKTRDNPTRQMTHVVDNQGVATRRFAYFETSRQQLMAALENDTSAFRGRFARYRRAMGVLGEGDIKSIPQDDTDLAGLYQRDVGAMTLDEMAHLHQYQGNEHQQRGVSLTSTPKREIVSNEGGTFRSHDGVRIKVDLSLVPKDVILLNHYSEGGVGDRLAGQAKEGKARVPGMLLSKPAPTEEQKRAAEQARSQGREPAKRPGYNFHRSVAKNRELFLSRLEPAWIVDLEDHLKDLVGPDGKTRQASGPAAIARVIGPDEKPGRHADLKDLRAKTGFDDYERGRKLGRTGQAKPTSDDPFVAANLALGHAAGVEERAGLTCGRGEYIAFWNAFQRSIDTKDGLRPKGPNDESGPAEVARMAANSVVPKDAGPDVKKPAIARAREMLTRRSAWFTLTQLRGRNLYQTGKPLHDGMHDSFWIGWAEAARGNVKEVEAKLKADPHPVPAPVKPAVTTPPPAKQPATTEAKSSRSTPPTKTGGGSGRTGGPGKSGGKRF